MANVQQFKWHAVHVLTLFYVSAIYGSICIFAVLVSCHRSFVRLFCQSVICMHVHIQIYKSRLNGIPSNCCFFFLSTLFHDVATQTAIKWLNDYGLKTSPLSPAERLEDVIFSCAISSLLDFF